MEQTSHRNALPLGYELHWYRIEGILGQGAFGITYFCHDINLDRHVAIKEYLPAQFAMRETDETVHPLSEEHAEQFRWGLDRFISEARTLTKFEHPNIVRVINVFEANNTAYMVMSYEVGKSLKDFLVSQGTLEEAELIKILLPILSGLEEVHEAGFIHRDIKPGNIFIRGDGSPVLLDFGSARQALQQQSRTLTNIATPGYAPIEQYAGKSEMEGPWTDIYGLGATLYRAVTGVTPADAVERSAGITQNAADEYKASIEMAAGRYSDRFLRAIDHALAFKSQDRPSSVREWREEFGVTRTGPTRPRKKMVKWGLHKGLIVALLFLLVIFVGLFIIASMPEQHVGPEVSDIDEPAQTVEQAVMVGPRETEPGVSTEAPGVPEAAQPVVSSQNAERIDKLLKGAETDFKAWRLSSPKGKNALDKYYEVLALDPNNQDAKDGIEAIVNRYVHLVYRDLDANKIEQARYYLRKASRLAPDADNVQRATKAWLAKREQAQTYSSKKRLKEFRERFSRSKTGQQESADSGIRGEEFKERIGGETDR